MVSWLVSLALTPVCVGGVRVRVASASTSAFYSASRDALLTCTIVNIVLAVIYWLSVTIAESLFLMREFKAGAGPAVAKGKRKSASGSQPGSPTAEIGTIDSTANPIFFSAPSEAMKQLQSTSSLPVDAPDSATWSLVRAQYDDVVSQNVRLSAELAAMKANEARAGSSPDENPSDPGSRPAVSLPGKRIFAPMPASGPPTKTGRVMSLKSLR